MAKRDLIVLFPREEESAKLFARRMEENEGEILAVLSGAEERLFPDESDLKEFLVTASSLKGRVRLATRDPDVASMARGSGIRVLDKTRFLKQALRGHEGAEEALRRFSPHVWRQELRTRLQAMGLLSLPKIRIWVLIGVSACLFLFVMFKLLPSAEIRVWPREDAVNQTVNIFLVQTGATVDLPQRVRIMPLVPIVVHQKRSITFDQISKEFIGTSAEAPMTIINKSKERYSLRSGTRLMNQAGMIFKTLDPINIEAGEELTVRTRADHVDLYGEIIGERGNVPAGLKWEFPGLAPEERTVIYGENRVAAKGGRTSYRTVLQQSDLDLAKKKLEQELLATAKQMVDEDRTLRNNARESQNLEILYYEELTKTTYTDFVLPTQFLGEPVNSIPIEGAITYTSYAYDAKAILDMLSVELQSHVGEGKRLLEETLVIGRMVVNVIDYSDDLIWIKLTVDLTGTEQFVLDSLSPAGARLNRKIREAVAGRRKEDALRIVKNFPEVEKVQIVLWPPFSGKLPSILSHITIAPQK